MLTYVTLSRLSNESDVIWFKLASRNERFVIEYLYICFTHKFHRNSILVHYNEVWSSQLIQFLNHLIKYLLLKSCKYNKGLWEKAASSSEILMIWWKTMFGLVWFSLRHINHYRLFNAKSSLYIYIKYIWFGLVGFYGILTIVGHLMLNPLYTYILSIIWFCLVLWHINHGHLWWYNL